MTRRTRSSGREVWDARLEAAPANPRDEHVQVTSKSTDKIELTAEEAAAMTVNGRLHAAGSLTDCLLFSPGEHQAHAPKTHQKLLSLINFPDGL